MNPITLLGIAAAVVAYAALASYLANCFYDIACEKGFYERRYFWIPFLLGLVGYLMVVALPDRKKEKTEQSHKVTPLVASHQVQKTVGKWTCPCCGNVLPGDVIQCKCGHKRQTTL